MSKIEEGLQTQKKTRYLRLAPEVYLVVPRKGKPYLRLSRRLRKFAEEVLTK